MDGEALVVRVGEAEWLVEVVEDGRGRFHGIVGRRPAPGVEPTQWTRRLPGHGSRLEAAEAAVGAILRLCPELVAA